MAEPSSDSKKDILEGVKKYFQELLSQQKEKETSDFLTRQQVAEMFSIDLSTVHNWTKQGKLIPYGMGGGAFTTSGVRLSRLLSHFKDSSYAS